MEELWPAGTHAARAVSCVDVDVDRWADRPYPSRFLTDSFTQEQGKAK